MPVTLAQAVEAYLTERRQLGFEANGSELHRFARYADEVNHQGPLTAELQIAWARLHVRKTTAGTAARRLQTLRPFVKYYTQIEPATAVVDPLLLGPPRARPTPHIYTSDELADLIDSATKLEGLDGLRGAAFATLFGLIAASGLRLSEAIQLTDADVDPTGCHVTIRHTKFRKSRWLPLQSSTADALVAWRQRRQQHWPRDVNSPFFVGHDGTIMKNRTVENVFERLRRSLGWVARGTRPEPRIHDLRHTFAVRRVQLWHEQGAPIEQAMFWLCTYLGHAKISDTYWYLTGVPELMAVAGHRFECYARIGAGGDA